jgi:hypothetical protein
MISHFWPQVACNPYNPASYKKKKPKPSADSQRAAGSSTEEALRVRGTKDQGACAVCVVASLVCVFARVYAGVRACVCWCWCTCVCVSACVCVSIHAGTLEVWRTGSRPTQNIQKMFTNAQICMQQYSQTM